MVGAALSRGEREFVLLLYSRTAAAVLMRAGEEAADYLSPSATPSPTAMNTDAGLRRAAARRQTARERALGLTLDRATLEALSAVTPEAVKARHFLRRHDYPRYKLVVEAMRSRKTG
jgi:hypothetical protein